MYLSRLEIFGFKTFAQKVDLRFDAGITNIVGPNGCGKSNIVDALRWSLGEQKSSVLRSEKMENVIFNGTKLRKPLNLSEVSLTIQNTRNVLPTEYSEVTITRRIYRSGESEYFLNRLPCRLKDINDLFMDTGMGADAYSVIELKMVEQILSDKTEDRRKLFEEAAGITKYKIRRRQTFNKLDTTKQDLLRANDIITEIEKKVNSLKRQTQKAKRYSKLMAQLKVAEVRLALFDYDRISAQLAPLTEKLTSLEHVAEQYLGEITRKESEVEGINTGLISREQRLREAQLSLEAIDKQIKSIEEEILISRERKNNLESLIRRYADENQSLLAKREGLTARITELESAIANTESVYNETRQNFDGQKTDFDAFEHTINERKSKLEGVRKELVQLIDEAAKKRNSYQLTKNNIQNLERKIADLENDIKNFQSHSGAALSTLDERNREKRELTLKVESMRADITARQTELESLRTKSDELRARKLEAEGEIKTLNARIAIIQKAIESHEGFPESVQFLLNSKTAGLDATVADGVSIKEPYKKAIEAALGEGFSFLIANTSAAIHDSFDQLKQSNKGNATFLNKEKMSLFRSGAALPSLDAVKSQIVGRATDLVKSNDPAIIELLLGDVALVETFAIATALAEKFPSVRFVTLDGEIVKGNYMVRGGGFRKDSGSIIGQRETLNHLRELVERAEKDVIRLSNEITSAEQSQKNIQNSLADGQNAWRNAEEQLVGLDKEISQSEYEQKRAGEYVNKNRESIEQALNELRTLQSSLNDMDPAMQGLDAQRSALEVESHKLEHQLSGFEKQRKEKSTSLSEIQSVVLRMEGELQNHRNSIETSRQQIADNDATLQHNEAESVAAQHEITKLSALFSTRDAELRDFLTRRDASEKARDAESQEVVQLREAVLKMETELKKIRRQRDELLESRHAMEQEHTTFKFEIRTLAERILREYDFNLTEDKFDSLLVVSDEARKEDDGETEEQASEALQQTQVGEQEKSIDEVLDSDLPNEEPSGEKAFDPGTAKSTIDDLRRKIKMLGPVNMEAFTEYTAEKERLEVLIQQRADLLEAESQLLQTIETINATAQKQFMDVFEKIRQNFITIFTSLFDSSEADLKMADHEDPLEATIDILARPTGKKIQHIALLSGGEKTLTAISLLFAIYLVKPSPFCILDEVDAPLDDTNIDKFTKILRDFSKDTQFIVVTHNKRTMEAAQNIFGITMQEAGVSKVVSVKFNNRGDAPDDIEELIRQNQVADLTQEVKEPPTGPVNPE